MDILAPVNKRGEIPILYKAGATEFYCGYVHINWLNKYNERLMKDNGNIIISLNRREKTVANVNDISELREMVQEANKCKSKLYLTLNALNFPAQAYNRLDIYIDEIIQIGIHGVIVTDIGLIYYLNMNYPQLKLILSTCQQVSNKWSSSFFSDLGIERITFPRHMSIHELIEITSFNSTLEYECFVLDGKCVYDDGNCKIVHNVCKICRDQFSYEYYSDYSEEINYMEFTDLSKGVEDFNRWTCSYPSDSTRINGWKNIGCGICTIPMLIKLSNITTLKISGRGLSLNDKYGMVKFVRKAILMAKLGSDEKSLMQLGKDVFGWPELCDNKTRCYMALK